MVEQRIPVLVVSGFLGAGKTTLVRHLLQDAQRTGVRVAVVSNEFGALGIDKALLGAGEAAYVELEGGCVCCQLSDALLDTLQMLWERVRPERKAGRLAGVEPVRIKRIGHTTERSLVQTDQGIDQISRFRQLANAVSGDTSL